jgi:hypothetical protein
VGVFTAERTSSSDKTLQEQMITRVVSGLGAAFDLFDIAIHVL